MIIGIDPGKKGGIAVLVSGGLMTVPMIPDAHDIALFIRGKAVTHVFLEKSTAAPRQGVVSMFNYGVSFGTLLGIVATLGLPHTLVPPATWTRVMHAGTKLADAKLRSLEAAMRLFPGHNWKASPKCKKAHDGMIDAALIAAYGQRILGAS